MSASQGRVGRRGNTAEGKAIEEMVEEMVVCASKLNGVAKAWLASEFRANIERNDGRGTCGIHG